MSNGTNIVDSKSLSDLLTEVKPYKNKLTNTIRYLNIYEWMVCESIAKQSYLSKQTSILYKDTTLDMETYSSKMSECTKIANSMIFWIQLEDTKAIKILYGKKVI